MNSSLGSYGIVLTAWAVVSAPTVSFTPCCFAQGGTGPKLTAAEQQVVAKIQTKLATKFNSKDNPGDQNTWYVLMFRDVAMSKTKSMSGTSPQKGLLTYSKGTSKQEKKEEDAVAVQGRQAAALAIARYLASPNAAAAELKPPATGSKPGVITRRDTQVAADRQWDFRAFDNEADAKAFLDSVKPKKK
jgi:hypothetical protein